MTLIQLKKDLYNIANPTKAKILQRFFKTGPGQYGEGDIFLGVMVPDSRKIARKYLNLSFQDIKELLKSKIHEERLTALLLLGEKFKKGNYQEKENIISFYLQSTQYVNNWDLVDLSAHQILGEYLLLNPEEKYLLGKLAKSSLVWERRISMIATYAFIKRNHFQETLKISEILLNDKHDLIHKAVGWMLREVGKRDQEAEENFLKKYYKIMPRTMLRYAIERFDEKKKKLFMKK